MARQKKGTLAKMLPGGLVCLAATLFALSSPSQEQSLDDFIHGIMKANNIPGLGACIVKKDKLVWIGAFGWADVEGMKPMTEETIQNIGSISKTITATAVMQLWEKGKFDLDDDVNKYLPFPVRNHRFP